MHLSLLAGQGWEVSGDKRQSVMGWAEMPLKNRMNKSRHARNAWSFCCNDPKWLRSAVECIPWAGDCCDEHPSPYFKLCYSGAATVDSNINPRRAQPCPRSWVMLGGNDVLLAALLALTGLRPVSTFAVMVYGGTYKGNKAEALF